MSIYIFSGPVHSGKTTELLNWCSKQKDVRGILMPDIEGSRKILNLHTKEIFKVECTRPQETTEKLVSIGRFHFYEAAFERANNIITGSLLNNPAWLVIDEAGKLELNGKGFYDALLKVTEFYNNKKGTGNLLLTVRESLCAEVICFFKLRDYRIIQQLTNIL